MANKTIVVISCVWPFVKAFLCPPPQNKRMHIYHRAKEKSYMFEERLETAGRLRQLGNERFGKGCMEDAAEAYER